MSARLGKTDHHTTIRAAQDPFVTTQKVGIEKAKDVRDLVIRGL